MLLTIIRAILGPTFYDRILATNAFSTITILFIAVFGFFTDRPEFLDLALLYGLVNFIATLAILKFFVYRNIDCNLLESEK